MTDHYSKLGKGKVNYVVPSNFEAQITGAKWAQQDKNGLVTVCYLDETTQSKQTQIDICKELEGMMQIVSFVQN